MFVRRGRYKQFLNWGAAFQIAMCRSQCNTAALSAYLLHFHCRFKLPLGTINAEKEPRSTEAGTLQRRNFWSVPWCFCKGMLQTWNTFDIEFSEIPLTAAPAAIGTTQQMSDLFHRARLRCHKFGEPPSISIHPFSGPSMCVSQPDAFLVNIHAFFLCFLVLSLYLCKYSSVSDQIQIRFLFTIFESHIERLKSGVALILSQIILVNILYNAESDTIGIYFSNL